MVVLVAGSVVSTSAFPLVEEGRSSYVIHHDAQAPASVKTAAAELQRAIALATGAKLSIATQGAAPMICLGDNALSRAAGLSAEDLPEEGFQIVTRDDNLYIVGKDTPDGQRNRRGGFSRGTQFGAYEFLGRVVGVRWLMPTDAGEDIPRCNRLTVPQLRLAQSPAFLFRVLGVDDPPCVKEWLVRHRVSGDPNLNNTACSRMVYTQHSWSGYLSEEEIRAHPA